MASSSGTNDEEDYEEEARQAAAALVSMKGVKLDSVTARRLEATKIKILLSTTLRYPPVPALDGKIGRCSNPFEKQLTASDVRNDQSRLSITKNDIETCLKPLLSPNDMDSLQRQGIPVTTYDAEGMKFPMTFKVWDSANIHVLTTGWTSFQKSGGFKEIEDYVSIWMFRHAKKTNKLCFVIISRKQLIQRLINN